MTKIIRLFPVMLLLLIGFTVFAQSEVETHTEVMAWSNITGVRMNGDLVDFESTLRTGNPDG